MVVNPYSYFDPDAAHDRVEIFTAEINEQIKRIYHHLADSPGRLESFAADIKMYADIADDLALKQQQEAAANPDPSIYQLSISAKQQQDELRFKLQNYLRAIDPNHKVKSYKPTRKEFIGLIIVLIAFS